MAEVLSQSQIDALLNAARNGEMDLAAKAESSSEKKYRKYDFYSPRKFTKDRLKMLSGIFENYTRIINSRINGLLHTTCEIDVESVEEQRYYEFSNALLEGDVLSLAGVELEGQVQPDETPVLFHFSTTGIRETLREMERRGAKRARVTAKIAGGARMFEVAGGGNLGNIGQRNIESVHMTLRTEGVRLLQEDVGGTVARTLLFDAATGQGCVRCYGKPELIF